LLLPTNAATQVVLLQRNEATPAPTQSLHLNAMGPKGNPVHVMPTPEQIKAIGVHNAANNGGTPPLLYHGGSVMHTPAVYAIFWIPPHLQDSSATSLSSAYQKIQKTMLSEYFGHSLMNNNTQYYDSSKWITNTGKLAGTYVDTSLYPGEDCFDSGVPDPLNCITDADIQHEVTKVMALKGWTGGVSKLFMVFTSSNEGSCFSSSSSACSYTAYCAYHSYFVNSALADVVYSNEPYGNTSACQIGGAPSPNGFPEADTAATASSHELTESITDPLLDAWYDSSGYEIGDECAYYYGFAGWDGGLANEQWDGHPFFLQTEYSNVLAGWAISASFPGCFNAGPDL